MAAASSRFRGFALAAGLLIAAAVGFFLWRGDEGPATTKAPAAGVPVTVAAVEQRDVAHRISSIGSVQSLHTVVIRPQVTGILSQILFREGDLVERGAPLALIDDRSIAASLAQAQAVQASREAQLHSAEVDLKRFADIADRQVISRQQMDQQAALVQRLKADVTASAATVASERVQLSHTRIVSPVRGRVGLRHIDAGNLLQASDEQGLVTVTQTDPISIVFTVPQQALGMLMSGNAREKAPVVSVLDRDAGTLLAEGKVTTFDNQIDPATGTLRLRAELANADGRLWPGQFVAVQLDTGVSKDVFVFPARALQQGLHGPFVFRITAAKAEVVPVVIAYQDDAIVAVADGLRAGDQVVIDGQSRLKAGTAVRASLPTGAVSAAGG